MMKLQNLLVTLVVCLSLHHAEGASVTFTVSCDTDDHTFDDEVELTGNPKTLINYLVQAANVSETDSFDFSANFMADDGFVITQMGPQANSDAGSWEVVLDPNTPITERLEEYIPADGSTVLFRFELAPSS